MIDIIGSFTPSTFHREVIERELAAWMDKRGWKWLTLTVRKPNQAANYGSDVYVWHQDRTRPGAPQVPLIGIWTSGSPTQFTSFDKTPLKGGNPYEVVVFDDFALLHRAPEADEHEGRWVARFCGLERT